MTNLVFIENSKNIKKHERALIKDLQLYASSVALKFPTDSISEKDKIKIAKFTVKKILNRHELSTQNLGSIIHDEIINNLQKAYFRLKRTISSRHFLLETNKGLNRELLEMIRIVKLLKKTKPHKFKRLVKSVQFQLTDRQKKIFNIYLKFNPTPRKKKLTYKTVSRLSKIPSGTINHQVKQMVLSLSKLLKTQKVNLNGRTK